MATDLTPYAQYKCNDDAANTVVTDDGTGENNGVASVNTSNLSVDGKIKKAFEFNGTDEYINIDDLCSDVKTNTLGSISVWAYPDNFATTTKTIFAFGETGGNNFLNIQFDINGKINTSLYKTGFAVEWRHQDASGRTAQQWYHIVVVQNGTSPKVYVNNLDVTNLTITDDVTLWLNDINTINNGRIGSIEWSSSPNSSFFVGEIDDVRYYPNKALTTDEIALLYNNGKGTEGHLLPEGFPHSQCYIIS